MKKMRMILSLGVVALCFSCQQETSKLKQEKQMSTIDLKDSPNVLLIMSDDLNTNIGPYKDIKNHTPNLDRLANEGMKFNSMYCQYPLCGPSRASFMSGLYPEKNGVLTNIDKLGSYRTSNPTLKDHPSMAGFF